MANKVMGALPLGIDLAVYAGDDFWLNVDVSDPATGLPVDLTGFIPSAQVRLTSADSTVLADFECEINTSTISLHLHHDDAAVLPAVTAWDLQITTADLDPVVLTLVGGQIKTTPEVTRL